MERRELRTMILRLVTSEPRDITGLVHQLAAFPEPEVRGVVTELVAEGRLVASYLQTNPPQTLLRAAAL